MIPVVLGVLVGACVFAIVRILLTSGQRASALRARIAPHVESRQAAAVAAPAEDRRLLARLEGVFGGTERRLGGTAIWRRLERLVERSDVPLRPAELFYLVLGGGLLLGLIVAVAGGSPPAAVVFPVLTVGLAYAFLTVRAGRRARAFDDQLPDLLTELAATLRVGYSLTQALDAIAEGARDPAGKELKRALAETRLGRPLDDALADMGGRVDSSDLEFVLNAVALQRQAGGSLAGLFDIVADTVRQRHQFARKLRSLTAMGRLSAYVLLGLPVAIAALLTLIDRPYIMPLYTTSTGHTMIAIGLVSMAVGALIMSRIVKVRG